MTHITNGIFTFLLLISGSLFHTKFHTKLRDSEYLLSDALLYVFPAKEHFKCDFKISDSLFHHTHTHTDSPLYIRWGFPQIWPLDARDILSDGQFD